MGRPSFFPSPKKQRLHVYSWQGKIGCVFPQTINHMHNSFSPPDNLLHEVDVLPCQGGERMGRLSFSQPSKKQRLHVHSWQGKVGCVFPHMICHMHDSIPPPDNLLNKVAVEPCQGGEWMGRPSFSPPPKKQRLHVYLWQGRVGCVFPRQFTICTTVFPPHNNLLNKVDFKPCQGGEKMGRPSFSPPQD